MENVVYNREEFLNNYRLTTDEYFLLPLEERMEYCRRKYEYLFGFITQIGDTICLRDYLDKGIFEFFTLNGCSVEYIGHGARKTEIKRKTLTRYDIPEGTADKLDYHIALIAEAKAQVIEDIIDDHFMRQRDLLKSEGIYSDENFHVVDLLKTIKFDILPEKYDEKYRLKIINAQMASVMERINNGETVEINQALSPIYKEFLKQQCKVEEENRVLKVLKP